MGSKSIQYGLIMALLLITFTISGCLGQEKTEKEWTMMRNKMVEQQIKARGISDENVLSAVRTVERHKFVPDNVDEDAYDDSPLPIGHGQTISQPYIVALMSSELKVQPGDKILEVGTGSGYQAAILAEMGADVYSIEIVEALAESARRNLQQAGYGDVKVKHGDGYQGWPEYAPFQGIIVTCSPSQVPKKLKEQLAEGGRIVIPVGGAFMQNLVLLTKQGNSFNREEIIPVRFVPMQNEEGKRY